MAVDDSMKDLIVGINAVTTDGFEDLLGQIARQTSGKAKTLSVCTLEQWRYRHQQNRWRRLALSLRVRVLFPLRIVTDIRKICRATPQVKFIVTSNPPWAIWAAHLAAPRGTIYAWLYDLLDVLLDDKKSADNAGVLRRWIYAVLSSACRLLMSRSLHQCGQVAFIGPQLMDEAKSRYSLSTGRVIPVPVTVQKDLRASSWATDEPLRISYVGNLGFGHDWLTLVNAHAMTSAPTLLTFAASGSRLLELIAFVDERNVENLAISGPLSDAQWRKLMSESPLTAITQSAAGGSGSLPSRLISSLAIGQAIVAVAPEGSDLELVVSKSGCGLVANPGESKVLAEALEKLSPADVRGMQIAAINLFQLDYELDAVASQWVDVLL